MGQAIGIDLGTTNSVMAILDSGRPDILENPTSIANPQLTPSVVAIDRYGQRLVGELAKAQAPEHMIFSIKRFMGRPFRDPALQREIERVPYQVTENSQNREVFVWLDGKPYSPSEISAFILESLKEQAEAQIGEEVTHAVITVPAYFTDRQKRATRLAGKLAGLEVMQLISEPTAAALAYGIDTRSTEYQKILIYDLGGGTFDTTVFFVAAGVFAELSRVGNNQLGGDDFDQAIINHIIDKTKDKYKINLSWQKDALQKLKLKAAAERAKIQLSELKMAEIVIPNIAQDDHGHQVDIDLPLTRTEYEKLIRPLVRRTINLVEKAIEEAGATPNEIDQVLLVGGSSVTPLVVQSLSKMFARQKIVKTNVDPMYCVALGAAIQSGVLPKTSGETEDDDSMVACPNCARLNLERSECRYCKHELGIGIRTIEIMPIPLGMQTVGDKMEIIIDKGTYYPTSKPISDVFRTAQPNQTSLRVPVYQGFSETASQNEYQGVAEGTLSRGYPVGTEVEVSFFIDKNGMLDVRAELLENPTEYVAARININTEPIGPDWKQQAQKILDQAASIFLPFGQNLLTQKQIEYINNLISQLQRATTMDDQVLAEYKAKELKQVMQDVGQVGWLIYGNYLLAHLTEIRPTEKTKLDHLVKQGTQANIIGYQSQLDASCTKIADIVYKIRQRIKSNAIDQTGLLKGTRLEEWKFPTQRSSK